MARIWSDESEARALARGRARGARRLGRARASSRRTRRGDSRARAAADARARGRARGDTAPRHGCVRRRRRRAARRRRALVPPRPDLVRRGRHRRSRFRSASAGELLLEGVDRALAAVVARAEEHRETVCIGRTHGIHAEPTTFGLKLAGWAFELDRGRERLRARARGHARRASSPAPSAPTRRPIPELERLACERLGLEPEPVSTQILAARPPRGAARRARARRGVARAVRARDPPPRAHRGGRGRGAVRPRAEGLVGDAAQAQPRRRRADLRARTRRPRRTRSVGLENVALWHERDISHSSAERVVIPDAFLALDYMLDRFAWLVEGLVVRPERMRAQPRGGPRALLQPAAAARARRVGARARRRRTGSSSATRCAPGTRSGTSASSSRADTEIAEPRRPRRGLRPRRVHPSRRHRLRAARALSPEGGARPCLRPRFTSAAGRCASSTRSTRSGCCSSRATASRPSTSSCRPRSPTRAACSPAYRRFWFARTREIVPEPPARAALRRPLDRVPAARDAAARVRRPRLPRRLGLEGLPGDRRRLRARAPGGAERVGAAARADLHARRRRRTRGTTRTSTASRQWSSSAPSASTRSSARRSSSTASRRSTRAARGILIADTKFEFGIDAEGRLVLGRRGSSRRTPRASGPPTSTRPGGRSRRSTSSSRATTASRSAGTRPHPGPELPEDVVAGTRARYVEAFERLTEISFDDYLADPEVGAA